MSTSDTQHATDCDKPNNKIPLYPLWMKIVIGLFWSTAVFLAIMSWLCSLGDIFAPKSEAGFILLIAAITTFPFYVLRLLRLNHSSGCCVTFLILFVGVPFLLLPTIQAGRLAANKMCCQNNLKALGTALHRYHDMHGSFPPSSFVDEDGCEVNSWRGALIPLLEIRECPAGPHVNSGTENLKQLYDNDQPWDSPENLKPMMLDNYCNCYEYSHPIRCPLADEDSDLLTTTYFAVLGKNTIWKSDGSCRKLEEIDRPGETIMLIENANSNIVLTEPGDLRLEQLLITDLEGEKESFWSQLETHLRRHPNGLNNLSVNVLMADGSVRTIHRLPTDAEIEYYFDVKKPQPPKYLRIPHFVRSIDSKMDTSPIPIAILFVCWLLQVVYACNGPGSHCNIKTEGVVPTPPSRE